MRPLSHSSISMYLECPQKYKFKYIERIPEKPKHYFSFGKSLHEALEFFYGVPALPAPPLREMLDFFEEHWISEGYKNAAQEAEYKDQGRKILSDFHRINAPSFRLPFFVEYPFNIKVDGVAVTGVVDRIDKLDNGKLAILDYKTGKAFDLERVKEDPQLTMYQMAVEQNLGMEVASLTFYHLNSQTPLTAEPHEPAQVDALRQRIVTTADSIQRQLFEPKPEEWKCRWCDYRPHCPVFRHQYAAAPEPVPDAHAPLPAVDKTEDELLAELVDRYGKKQAQALELQADLDDLKVEIVELLKKKGYMRAFGALYEAALSSEDRWEFKDKTAVIAALKRLGLYERVLKPSAPEVQKLLSDEALGAEARRELRALAKRVEQAALSCRKIAES